MHFVPHTDDEIAEMLAFMGLSSVEELFDAVPAALRLAGGLDMAPGLAEADVAGRFDAYAGAYDHDIPSVVGRVAFRSEFVTAYTPYQPEVAQGVLQALFEYQTLVCRLFGTDVANASLYDGASSASTTDCRHGRRRAAIGDSRRRAAIGDSRRRAAIGDSLRKASPRRS